MCGLVGVCSLAPQSSRDWLAAGAEAIRHRGPDDVGEWWSNHNKVGLAHRRLSVIDLSPSGHQPMVDVANQLAIVFNGEIYNFQDLRAELLASGYPFKSQSDTEVILAAYQAWGVDCVSHLNGMFAFALFDGAAQRMFFARDRAGEKPFFYFNSGDTLYFASELKGLLVNPALPRAISHEALSEYLTCGYVSRNRCLLAGYSKLPPAHAMLFDLTSGSQSIWRYWEPPLLSDADQPVTSDDNELIDELDNLLQKAVQAQMLADVPVGVLLSGGVDSSLITAMAARAGNRVKTFTVGFPGHGALDERAHARLIANHYDTEHTELEAPTVSVDILKALAVQFDEPIVDSSMIPTYLVSQLVRQHCTVALGGDGGDELFGGYSHYSRLLWAQKKLSWLPLAARRVVGASAQALLPIGFKGRNWLQSLGNDFKNSVPKVGSYFDRSAICALLPQLQASGSIENDFEDDRILCEEDLLQRLTRYDFEHYLPEDILVKVERASMLNSLELRAPFLDQSIIEFAFGRVPSRLKANANEKKILLKKLTDRLLPSEFDRQRKQGFSIPLAAWLQKGEFRDLFYSVLLDSECVFNRDAVTHLLRGQDLGRNSSERLFALVLFELWRKEYRLSLF
jgi:asparagine synthase (glutamine-hydrolysing)